MNWTYDPTKPIEFHPLADILPAMAEEEFKTLTQDIKANGLQVPIVIYQGKILDGRNRYKAAGKNLKQENFTEYNGIDPVAQVLALNVNRRHLSTSQRAIIAAKLAAAKVGFNQHSGVAMTTEKAAKLLNVSEASVKNGKAVFEHGAKEVIEKVQKGELKLGKAKQIVKKSNKEVIRQGGEPTARGGEDCYFSNEEQVAKLTAPEPKLAPSVIASDKVDKLADAYVEAVKEFKKLDPEGANDEVSNLVQRLQDLGFLKAKPKKAA